MVSLGSSLNGKVRWSKCLPSKDGLVGNALLGGDHKVALASDVVGDLAGAVLQGGELLAADGEVRAEGSARGLGLVNEGDAVAAESAGGVVERNRGEGGEVEERTLRAGNKEGSGQGEDRTRAERGVEGGRDGLGGLGDTDEGLVAGLDGRDGRGDTENGRVGDERGSTKVGGDADGLEGAGGRDHGGGISEAEVVLAGLDGLEASLGDGTEEEGDVSGLSLADLLQGGDALVAKAEGAEIVIGEGGEALRVESRLEVLSSQSAVNLVRIKMYGQPGALLMVYLQLQDVDVSDAAGGGLLAGDDVLARGSSVGGRRKGKAVLDELTNTRHVDY